MTQWVEQKAKRKGRSSSRKTAKKKNSWIQQRDKAMGVRKKERKGEEKAIAPHISPSFFFFSLSGFPSH